MKNRTWIRNEETLKLDEWGKDVSIRAFQIEETGAYLLIDRGNMFIFEDTDYQKCYNQISLYK